MADFGINEMLEMQKALQEKQKDKWKPICPDRGKDQLLWMIGEIGEVIDIIKKHGGEKASQDAELREHLIEEFDNWINSEQQFRCPRIQEDI